MGAIYAHHDEIVIGAAACECDRRRLPVGGGLRSGGDEREADEQCDPHEEGTLRAPDEVLVRGV
jgi:hypothetical protein